MTDLTIAQLQDILSTAKPDEHEHLDSFAFQMAHQLLATMQREQFLNEFFTRIIKAAPYHSPTWRQVLEIAQEADAAVNQANRNEYREGEPA
jgi:hypothetical protein